MWQVMKNTKEYAKQSPFTTDSINTTEGICEIKAYLQFFQL